MVCLEGDTMKQLKNCQKMTELMSLSQEEPLTLSQKMTVKFHLLMCPTCRRFDDNNRVLKEMIKKHKNLKG
ncbi:zf-HC2 domain-containing protein [Moraxella ovis]